MCQCFSNFTLLSFHFLNERIFHKQTDRTSGWERGELLGGLGYLFCTNETPLFGTGGIEESTSGEESANTDTTGQVRIIGAMDRRPARGMVSGFVMQKDGGSRPVKSESRRTHTHTHTEAVCVYVAEVSDVPDGKPIIRTDLSSYCIISTLKSLEM